MTDEITYKNNPLHGVGLKKMLTELTDHYGFEILFAYLNINCFKTNPSVASSVKFLKKTDWAREKVEGFYLYSFKNLPKPSHEQHQLSPRDRLIPDDQSVGMPAELSLEEAEQLRTERESKAAEYDSKSRSRASRAHNAARSRGQASSSRDDRGSASKPSNRSASTASNPWGIPKSGASKDDSTKT